MSVRRDGDVEVLIQYAANYQSGSQTIWKVEEYESAIKNIPNLQELVRNPFMLSLALDVLPRLVDLSKDLKSSKISRVTLHDQCVEQWIDRELGDLSHKFERTLVRICSRVLRKRSCWHRNDPRSRIDSIRLLGQLSCGIV